MKQKVFLLLFLLLLGSSFVYSQISEGGKPPSFVFDGTTTKSQQIGGKDFINLPVTFNVNNLLQEDAVAESTGVPLRMGVVIPVRLSMEDSGDWVRLSNGQEVWQLTIKARDAKAISVLYDEFYIPEGDKLFIYSANKRHVIGAFTNKTNTYGKEFATELVAGDEVILEYVPGFSETSAKPAEEGGVPVYSVFGENQKLKRSAKDTPRIVISGITYAYNHVYIQNADHVGLSDYCHVDINCPEGDDWQIQKKGVFKSLLIKEPYVYFCSGTLVNNTLQNLDPLLLTASHCIENSSLEDLNRTIYYFHFEQETCGEKSELIEMKSMVGAEVLAQSYLRGGSDVALLRMHDRVPIDYDVYYNGWDVKKEFPNEGVGIHHPVGDTKKISTYLAKPELETLELGDGSVGAVDAHFRVLWVKTDTGWGITEGGSSGSPLFNEEKLVVGTLSAGPQAPEGISLCELIPQSAFSVYGRMWYHFDQAPTEEEHLNRFLDPMNSGITRLEGTHTGTEVWADFAASKTDVYVSEPVTFINRSVNSNTIEWHFEGGTPSVSNEASPVVTYNAPGKYKVSIIVNKGAENEKEKVVEEYMNVTLKMDVTERLVAIGEGEETSNFPLGQSVAQTYSSSIYTADEIKGGGIIDKLFWQTTSVAMNNRTVSIYLKEVDEDTQTAASWAEEIADATFVAQTFNVWSNLAGWNQINLNAPFTYSGTKNLKVLVSSVATEADNLASAETRYTNAASKHQYWTANELREAPQGNGVVNAQRPNIKIGLREIKEPTKPVAKFNLNKDKVFGDGFDMLFNYNDKWTIETFGESERSWEAGAIGGFLFSDINPESIASALVPFDEEKVIDAWLISHEILLPEASIIEFYQLHFNNLGGVLSLNISEVGETSWDQIAVFAARDPQPKAAWHKASVDLSAYANKNVRIAFRYYGRGNTVGLDDVLISSIVEDEKVEIFKGDFIKPVNNSVGGVVNNNWKFEGGKPEVSTEVNPVVQYNEIGEFTVSLSVSNSKGEDVAVREKSVIVKDQKPIAGISVDAGFKTYPDYSLFIPTHTSILFKDASANFPSSYSWTFEGGTPETSSEANVEVVYETPGVYDLKQNVSNTAGSSEAVLTDYIVAGGESYIWNIPEGDTGDYTYLWKDIAGDYGYITGANGREYYIYAEKFSDSRSVATVEKVKIMFNKESTVSSDQGLYIAVADAKNGLPNTVYGLSELKVEDILDKEYTEVVFQQPAVVQGEFFILIGGMKDIEGLSIMTSEMTLDRENTFYVYIDLHGWGMYTDWLPFNDPQVSPENSYSLSLNVVPSVKYTELSLSSETLLFKDKENSAQKIDITSNASFKHMISDPWVKVVDVEDGSISINVEDNFMNYRKGTVSIFAGGIIQDISIEQSTASPANVSAKYNGVDEVDVSWSTDYKITEDIFEDFEGHPSFMINSPGEIGWTYLDKDQSPIDSYGLNFPNVGLPHAFITFEDQALNPKPTNNRWGSKSGAKCLASFPIDDFEKDDWIISPQLNFTKDFKLSFWARAYSNEDLLIYQEKFHIYYSVIGSNMFIKLTLQPTVVTNDWELYEYELPADAQYVAINTISREASVLFIDDIFIGTGQPPATTMAERSYTTGADTDTTVNFARQLVQSKDFQPASIYPINEAIVTDSQVNALVEKYGQEYLDGMNKRPNVKAQVKALTETELASTPKDGKPIAAFLEWTNGQPFFGGSFGGQPFEIGARFVDSDLTPYYGLTLKSVYAYLGDEAHFVVKIYKNGEVISSQEVDSYDLKDMNIIELSTPVVIDETFTELIIGLDISAYDEEAVPVALDTRWLVPERGGRVKLEGAWYDMFDVNSSFIGCWVLSGIVEGEIGGISNLFSVYRDDELIAKNLENVTYKDTNVPGGLICYNVSATQNDVTEIESSLSEKVCVQTKYLLSVKANNIEKIVGEDNPDVSDEYSIKGFVDEDGLSYLSTLPVATIDPIFKSHIGVGTYNDAVLVSGAEDNTDKYRFEYLYGQLIVKDAPVGIEDVQSDSVKIYPTLTEGVVHVDQVIQPNDCYVYDFLGRLVLTKKLVIGDNTLDISSYEKGVYFVKVGNLVTKVVKR